MNTIDTVISEAHASRSVAKASPEGTAGIITDVRTQGLGSDQEALSIQMVIPGFKPGWFNWYTARSEGQYAFGKRIVSELNPELQKALTVKDQLAARVFIHSAAGFPALNALIGAEVRITVKEGNAKPEGGKYPPEFIPHPHVRVPMSEEDVLQILQTAEPSTPELETFA